MEKKLVKLGYTFLFLPGLRDLISSLIDRVLGARTTIKLYIHNLDPISFPLEIGRREGESRGVDEDG